MKVKYAVAMMLGASVWAGGVGAQQIQINKENKTIAITTSDRLDSIFSARTRMEPTRRRVEPRMRSCRR